MIILFCMILLFATNESSSQCVNCIFPSSQESFQMEIPNTSCTITVNYCLTCSPTGNTIVKLCSIEIPYNSNCLGTNLDASIFNILRKEMAKDGAQICAVTNGIPIGPCPNRAIIETYLPTCVGWAVSFDFSGGIAKVSLVPCANLVPGECLQEWEICYQDPDYILTPVGLPFKDSGVCDVIPLYFVPPFLNNCVDICE